MSIRTFFIALIIGLSVTSGAQVPETTAPKYIKTAQGYLMVLKQGDNLINELEQLSLKENIPSATLSGLGFANVEFGYFNYAKKSYKAKRFEDLEIAALEGSIGWQEGKPSVHAHCVGSDKNYKARAGHILALVVSTGTLEVVITVHEKRLERRKDEVLGANVLDLDAGPH